MIEKETIKILRERIREKLDRRKEDERERGSKRQTKGRERIEGKKIEKVRVRERGSV